MCFSKELTAGFTVFSTVIGLTVLSRKGIWAIDRWRSVRIALCFFYFALMEFLQFVQYLVINQCTNPTNVFWTSLGWIHIAFQPVFSNLALSALDNRNLDRKRDQTWLFLVKFCIVAGFCMSLRIVLPAVIPGLEGVAPGATEWFKRCTSSDEGICGPQTCSTSGRFHVQWDFKMIKPSYPFPGIAFHFINMFIAPAILGLHFATLVLFLTGPGIALLFAGVRDGERAAIWCFFSVIEALTTVVTQYVAIRVATKRDEGKEKKE
jgi:hypothetical protein